MYIGSFEKQLSKTSQKFSKTSHFIYIFLKNALQIQGIYKAFSELFK